MKKLNLFFTVMIFLGGLNSGSLFGQGRSQSLVLDYQDSEYQGDGILYLKMELRNQYPEIDVRRLVLDSAHLIAKSRFGRGTAVLQVGDNFGRDEIIYGDPRDFDNPDPRTFNRVNFYNPSDIDLAGVWQIHLQGDIKVRRVVLKVRQFGPRIIIRDRLAR